ncbi:anti-sigma factor [Pseudoflavonifractor sp. An85]|uniref:anti-sigma factor family protein n=1 Tax=Pseudoflavonifractor sp. An85 TaxID=1965661 RepID=UPI000B3AFBE4|nr:anti-sigma factor [Pseudoflavonifractor sp. An85]OUN25351.1 hypothetical protein B5G37_03820 [Pseudoflavonifractor sp. An85]
MLEHETYLEWISADLDGELSPHQREQLNTHLRTCPSCAQLYQELSAQSQAIKAMDCTLPPHLHQDILEHLPPQVSVHRPKKAWKMLAPLAACLALVVTLGYFSQNRTPVADSPSTPTTAAFFVQPRSVDVPNCDQILLLSAPLSQEGLELLENLPTSTLADGSVCCVADPDTTSALVKLLEQSGVNFTRTAPSSPDGSGNTAIVWPAS